MPTLNWAPCGPAFPRAECANAHVPLDHDQPRGATTSIALARIPASNAARKIGTVFVNPGGPGSSGIDLVLFGFGDSLAALLDGRLDIVDFDPRGIASSNGLRCFDTESERDALLAGLPLFPYQRAQERPHFEAYRAFGRRCRAASGDSAPHEHSRRRA